MAHPVSPHSLLYWPYWSITTGNLVVEGLICRSLEGFLGVPLGTLQPEIEPDQSINKQ
jgi:hypothetical protein